MKVIINKIRNYFKIIIFFVCLIILILALIKITEFSNFIINLPIYIYVLFYIVLLPSILYFLIIENKNIIVYNFSVLFYCLLISIIIVKYDAHIEPHTYINEFFYIIPVYNSAMIFFSFIINILLFYKNTKIKVFFIISGIYIIIGTFIFIFCITYPENVIKEACNWIENKWKYQDLR